MKIIIKIDKVKEIKRLSRNSFKDIDMRTKTHIAKHKYTRKVKHKNYEGV